MERYRKRLDDGHPAFTNKAVIFKKYLDIREAKIKLVTEAKIKLITEAV